MAITNTTISDIQLLFVNGLKDGMSKTSKDDPQQTVLEMLEYTRPHQKYALDLLDYMTRKGITCMYHLHFFPFEAKSC